jgi:hypothetical protein
MRSADAITLADLGFPTLEILCEPCGRNALDRSVDCPHLRVGRVGQSLRGDKPTSLDWGGHSSFLMRRRAFHGLPGHARPSVTGA